MPREKNGSKFIKSGIFYDSKSQGRKKKRNDLTLFKNLEF